MKGLDRFLTTEPDNGFGKWCDEVWEIVTKEYSSDVPQEDVDNYWDTFFEPLTLKLSVSGTLPSGGCSPRFAAMVIRGKWARFKGSDSYGFLLPILKARTL